jgi:hypothetical protein
LHILLYYHIMSNQSGENVYDRVRRYSDAFFQFLARTSGLSAAREAREQAAFWASRTEIAGNVFGRSANAAADRHRQVAEILRAQGQSYGSAEILGFERAALELIISVGAIPERGLSDAELRQMGMSVQPSDMRQLHGLRLVELPQGWSYGPTSSEPTSTSCDSATIRDESGRSVLGIHYRARMIGDPSGYVMRSIEPTEQAAE